MRFGAHTRVAHELPLPPLPLGPVHRCIDPQGRPVGLPPSHVCTNWDHVKTIKTRLAAFHRLGLVGAPQLFSTRLRREPIHHGCQARPGGRSISNQKIEGRVFACPGRLLRVCLRGRVGQSGNTLLLGLPDVQP